MMGACCAAWQQPWAGAITPSQPAPYSSIRFRRASRGGTVTRYHWFYGVEQPGFGRCGICGPARRAHRPAARRTVFSFKSTPSDDLPSRVIRSALQGVNPRDYSQMMRRAEQLGPQKLPSQVTRRAATARAVLPSGARPAFGQSKWKAGISRHPAHTGSDGHAASPLSKPAGPSRLPLSRCFPRP